MKPAGQPGRPVNIVSIVGLVSSDTGFDHKSATIHIVQTVSHISVMYN